MKKGILYGVGVGPGDPELLTLKAQRILKEADVIAVPDKGTGEKTALSIIGPLAEGTPLLYCAAPMTRDPDCLEAAYEQNARQIAALLDEGKTVAFITLGDPSIYSTYLYTHRKVLAMGYEGKLIPGVPSFCAVAAKLGDSLADRAQQLHIIPSTYEIEEALTYPGSKVLMKAASRISAVKDRLKEKEIKGIMVENCGMPDEHIYETVDDMPERASYYSIVVVKENKHD